MPNPPHNTTENGTPDAPKGVNRRSFFKGAAAGAAGAAGLVGPNVARPAEASTPSAATGVLPPSPQQVDRDTGNVSPPEVVRAAQRPGSDLMVQVLRDLGIEFVAANPGSSFEGIQESIANYGNPPNVRPEFITCLHEETSVDMANGYAKAEGRPMCAMLHGTIGLQHASMAIYQAFYSGTPMLLLAGRDDGFIQAHTANDMAGFVRSITKWDAQPTTLMGALEAIQEAYRQAVTPPTAPTLVVLDMELQKEEAGDMVVPAFRPPTITGIDPATAGEVAQRLLGARNPRINVGRLRTPEGIRLAVDLAELVGASTSTGATGGPMSFPERHPLCGPGADTDYDFTLGLEAGGDFSLRGPGVDSLTLDRDVTGIGFGGLRSGGGGGGGRGGRGNVDTTFEVDAEASLTAIMAETARLMTPLQRQVIESRRAAHASANQAAYLRALEAAIEEKKVGWDATPISTARLYAELWPLIMDEDWCLSSPSNFSGGHHRELWEHNRPYSYLGGQGAGGMGYGAGASGGAALAARGRNRIVVNIQTDGDLNYTPGVLWSAVHHRLPLLTVMHNNRAWHQELMFLQYLAGVRGRGTDRAHIGTTLRNPFIDYGKMAEAYGMTGEGPIEDPRQLQAALRRGVAAAKRGEPYMIDVITQPR